MEERYREQKIARRRLAELVAVVAGRAERRSTRAIRQINGEKGNAESFDELEKLLDQQWYRLAYWRVAADEINYRRFFDINDLAAIRVEDPRVFDAVHRLVGHLLDEGLGHRACASIIPTACATRRAISRICKRLYRSQQPANGEAGQEIYVVAEKILSGDEPLPSDWAVCGTTGYDLLNILEPAASRCAMG